MGVKYTQMANNPATATQGLPPGLDLEVANQIAAGDYTAIDFYYLEVGAGDKGTTEYMLAIKDPDGGATRLLEPLGRIFLGGETERLAAKHERGY